MLLVRQGEDPSPQQSRSKSRVTIITIEKTVMVPLVETEEEGPG